jgi:DNA-binding MarR family transcriptional regulator
MDKMSTRNARRINELPPQQSKDAIREIIYMIRRLIQADEQYTKALNKKYQVSAPQLHCLLALYEQGPMPPSQIATYVMVNSSTVTGILDRLEQKGFVRRLRTSADRRVITIELTAEGERLARHAPPPFQAKVVEGLGKLPRKEIEQIKAGLSKLTHLLDVQDLPVS